MTAQRIRRTGARDRMGLCGAQQHRVLRTNAVRNGLAAATELSDDGELNARAECTTGCAATTWLFIQHSIRQHNISEQNMGYGVRGWHEGDLWTDTRGFAFRLLDGS